MDPLILTIVTRSVERLLVVLAGALAIYLGYRLFIDMPNAERGSGKVNLPGGISIFLSRVGPGVFFSLFGAIVIALSFHYGISFSDVAQRQQVAVADSGVQSELTWSGVAPQGAPADPAAIAPYERSRVLAIVASLNRVETSLPTEMKATDRVNLIYALRDARVRLLVSVWDAGAWGDVAAFRKWIEDNEPNPPPQAVAAAAELYRQGRAGAAP